MDGPKATRILIEYENGEVREASGADAAKILEWWQSCESMNYIHGARYEGPFLKVTQEPRHA